MSERRANENISEATFKEVVRGRRPLLLQLTGGEPTIHPAFDKLLRWALRRVPIVNFTTNGAGGPDHYSHLLNIRGKKPFVVFSLDAPDERHDAIRRRKGLFREILESTLMLRDASIPVSWNCTVFQPGVSEEFPEGNISAVTGLIALSKKLGIPFNAQPASGAPTETRRALGEILSSSDSRYITNSPRFIRMFLTGDSGLCRFNTLNVSLDLHGEPLPTRPGKCYFAEDCSRCYYTCVWEPTFLLTSSFPEAALHYVRVYSRLATGAALK